MGHLCISSCLLNFRSAAVQESVDERVRSSADASPVCLVSTLLSSHLGPDSTAGNIHDTELLVRRVALAALGHQGGQDVEGGALVQTEAHLLREVALVLTLNALLQHLKEKTWGQLLDVDGVSAMIAPPQG